MKELVAVFLLILIIGYNSFSQNLSHEYGKVGKGEIDYIYDNDPEVEAVVLFDIGYAVFAPITRGDGIVFTRKKRLKVLSQSGVNYANFEIPYFVDGFDRTEYINNLEGATYNIEDGQIVRQELDLSTVFDEIRNDKWYVKKIPMPNVKSGSIIEINYELHSPFLFNLPDWQFQDDIPTLYSEYKVRMSPNYDYVYLAQGFSEFTRHDVKRDNLQSRTKTGSLLGAPYSTIQTFVMEDVPAFKDESFISDKDDYIMKIDFQLAQFVNSAGGLQEVMSTWPSLNSQILKREKFGRYIKKTRNLSSPILGKLNLTGEDQLTKSKLIIDYVKKKFRWNGYQSMFASQSPRDFIQGREGNTADINLFLIALLQEAGIDASPVILSTRDHGKVRPNYAFLHYFNYVIPVINLPSTSFVADGTDVNLTYNRIPPRCINDMGLKVTKNDKRWIKLYNEYPSTINTNLNIVPRPAEGLMEVRSITQSTEYASYDLRSTYSDDENKIAQKFKGFGFNDVDEVKVLNEDNPVKPYIISIDGEVLINEASDLMFIKPLMNFPIAENLLKQPDRSYPVDFIYRTKNSYTSYVEIPSDYDVFGKPDDFSFEDQTMKYGISTSVTEEQITVKANYEFKKSLYLQSDYKELKYNIDELIKHINGEIVLQKKKS